jgi:hypothetical protein
MQPVTCDLQITVSKYVAAQMGTLIAIFEK